MINHLTGLQVKKLIRHCSKKKNKGLYNLHTSMPLIRYEECATCSCIKFVKETFKFKTLYSGRKRRYYIFHYHPLPVYTWTEVVLFYEQGKTGELLIELAEDGETRGISKGDNNIGLEKKGVEEDRGLK